MIRMEVRWGGPPRRRRKQLRPHPERNIPDLPQNTGELRRKFGRIVSPFARTLRDVNLETPWNDSARQPKLPRR